MADRFEKFTERARKVLQYAQEEADRLNHNYIGTEHLLLGIAREGDGLGARTLASLDLDVRHIRAAVEFVIGRGDRAVTGDIGLTPRAKRVIELSVDEAQLLGQEFVGTEHLLLGLIREGEGIGAAVLESRGDALTKVRARVLAALADPTVLLRLSSAAPADAAAEWRERRRRWEYLELVIEGDRWGDSGGGSGELAKGEEYPVVTLLDALGDAEWQLAGVVSEPSGQKRLFFKRPVR
jgi:ATP-dependent Clp protease ATP-binding subunit ClpA